MSDNLNEIVGWIEGVVRSVEFTRKGEEQSLGRDLVGIVAQEIADAASAGTAPDGTSWSPNAPAYARYKAKRYSVGEHAPNIRTGQMLSLQSLVGQPLITADRIEMKYGLGVPPSRTATGVPLSESDRSISDVEKAFFNNESRPFFFMTESIADACMEMVGKVVAQWIEES